MRGISHFRRVTSHGLSALGIVGGIALVIGTAAPAMACNDESFTGTICAFSFNWCPNGWLPADGRQISINGNQALYSLIGTQYGGSPQSGQFGLPDLRGRAIVSYGTGPGLPAQPFAGATGMPTTTLSVPNLPPHNHAATFTGTGGGTQSVTVPADPGTLGVTATLSAKDSVGGSDILPGAFLGKGPSGGGGAASIYVPSTTAATEVALGGLDVQLTGTPGHGAIGFSYQTGLTGGTVAVGNTGNGVAFSNQSPSLAVSYCIQTLGLYPPRP
ncbi:phage tail protein [Pleomorphomonas sp. NRK KF1]|uniref:phage tail protein n=1 Tax=Pleomorphomonas sp. NRK KF1 TaxID=2943000 RepID=UPI002042E499|nr:tail fiber protein [Pleomorphomonas sp. NRK KF1]MCM5552698.1 tail fiber protein [Pleomorphomonas sp. NRK KF1]